jgi:hypothetical protein
MGCSENPIKHVSDMAVSAITNRITKKWPPGKVEDERGWETVLHTTAPILDSAGAWNQPYFSETCKKAHESVRSFFVRSPKRNSA